MISLSTKKTGLNYLDCDDMIYLPGSVCCLIAKAISAFTGGPLLLMELASLLVESGAHVHWITAKHMELVVTDPVVQALEVKLKTRGVQAQLPSSPTTLTLISRALEAKSIPMVSALLSGPCKQLSWRILFFF